MSLHGINEACYYSRHDTHQNLGKHQLTIGMMKRQFLSWTVVVVVPSSTTTLVVVSGLPGTIVGSWPSLVFEQSNEGLNTKMNPR